LRRRAQVYDAAIADGEAWLELVEPLVVGVAVGARRGAAAGPRRCQAQKMLLKLMKKLKKMKQ
jgi:hypothetical protein